VPVARTHSIALVGVEGHAVEIESDIENGLPGLLLVGLPDTAPREPARPPGRWPHNAGCGQIMQK
jgi:magnesium chelatase family protein